MNPTSFSQPRVRVLIPTQIDAARFDSDGDIHTFTGRCMGTSWCVRLVAHHDVLLVQLEERIGAILAHLENQMSHFRPQSDLCRFASLPAGESLALPVEFARVLRGALDIACLSEGAFDPTIAPLVDAWGFGAGPRFSDAGFIPPQAGSETVRGAGWRNIEIDEHDCIKQVGGMALNLAAIAKGFAADMVSDFLTESGWKNHLVEVGGELRGVGVKPDGQPWWVALELPSESCPLPATRIALHGLAVATSGDYRRYYHLGDRRIHHTFDPRSGQPVTDSLSSVTVIHRKCMFADAWATAIMVLGPNKGLELAEDMKLCALLQWHDSAGKWAEASSTAWLDMLQ